MPGTSPSYSAGARTLHWLTALVVITVIPLGLLANRLPYATDGEVARTFFLFSFHKTLGIGALLLGLLRVYAGLTRPRPLPLHPERRVETFLAQSVHWTLTFALILVPLAGWFAHAAVPGLAPIRWPFGQTLPFIGQDPAFARGLGALHRVFAWTLLAAFALHLAGVLKHAIIDRDATLARMLTGAEVVAQTSRPGPAPWLAAAALWALSLALGLLLSLTATRVVDETPREWPIRSWQIALVENGRQVASLPTLSGLLTMAPEALGDDKGTLDLTLPLDALEGTGADQVIAALPFPILQFLGTVTGSSPDLAAAGTFDLGGATIPAELGIAVGPEGASITGSAPLPEAAQYTLTIAVEVLRP